MMIDVKGRDEEGNVLFEGKLNRAEVGFMLQYAVNDLIQDGVIFNLQDEDTGEVRFKFPTND